MCREAAVLELAAQIPGILLAQMWVCDLVMSRSIFGGYYVPGTVSKIQTPDI